MPVNIIRLTEKEIREAAALHKITYERDHFTSRLPVSMLSEYYREIASENAYSLVAVDESGKVVGVLLAGENTRSSIKRFIGKNWLRLFFVLLLNPAFILQKIKDFFILFGNSQSAFKTRVPMRYLNLLVHPSLHGKGVGKLLTDELESAMKRDGIKEYGHSVKATNIKTIKFHLKNGCTVEHENDRVIYFIKQLN